MKKIWNKFTDIFGGTIFHPQYIINSHTKTGLEAVKKYGKGKLLDIGCGRSPYKKTVLKWVDSYTGVDRPKTSRLYQSHNIPDYYADAKKLPFKDNFFDTVIMLQLMEYLDQPEKALKEAHRVLKKDGFLILTSPFMYPIHDGELDHNRFTQSAISQLLKSAGLKIVKVEPQGNFFDFIIQSVLVYHFKKTMLLTKSGWGKILVVPLIVIGLFITPLANYLALFARCFDQKSDFPLNILAVARKQRP